jgi:hypothetical protein
MRHVTSAALLSRDSNHHPRGWEGGIDSRLPAELDDFNVLPMLGPNG